MKKYLILIVTMAMVLGLSSQVSAQSKRKKKKKGSTEQAPPKDKGGITSIKDAVKECSVEEGLFTMYVDSLTGKTYMEVSDEQLDKEFIYFSYIENGAVEAGAFRGAYRSSKVFKIQKYYGNLEFELINTKYYFDEDNAISKSSEANINKPVVFSAKIAGQNKDETKFLIESDGLFMSETFGRLKPTYRPGWKGLKLGKINMEKSRAVAVKNYPENTDVRVKLAFENPPMNSFGSPAITDGRFVNVVVHQSLIAMPENDYKPRRDDPRVGYFMTSVNDLTSADVTPYRDMIHRWNLQKTDPSAAVSDVVKPITWWIENTTPEELRPIIKEGVEKWNIAFEAAGFRNAVVVKIQPDDAEWDAGDIRYNVLRWTSSPYPPFGGYGPSFVNPRTGEILGADIMLEYVYILGRLRSEEIFDVAGLGIENEERAPLFFGEMNHNHKNCELGSAMAEQAVFAQQTMELTDISEIDKDRFLVESIQRLVLHEVGHTLGLNHNMKGSSIQSVEDLKDMAKMPKEGMCNSVMEYPAINFALNKEEQALFYDSKPGAYDMWAINFGYSQGVDDPKAEETRLQEILSESDNPMLVFGNDGDDMRSAGKAIDPMVNIYDLSSDPVAYGVDRMMLIEEKLMPNLLEKFSEDGNTYAKMRSAYLTLTGQKARQLVVISKHIGGISVNRNVEGDGDQSKDPYTPMSKEHQKSAMSALSTYAFAPDAWEFDDELMRHLQIQRRGFNQPYSGEDPRLHDRVLNIQNAILRHLLHENVLKRITDSELYGNEYSLSEYMTDLTNSIFKADNAKDVNSVRQNLQLSYTSRLISYLEKKNVLPSTKSMVLYELNRIKGWSASKAGNTSTKAHRMHLQMLIEKALEN